MKNKILNLNTVIKLGKGVEIRLGNEQAIRIREEGWKEVKRENLVLVAPEATLNRPLTKSIKARGFAVSEKKIKTCFIENINSPQSLEKNLGRLKQGIDVRHLNHHGFSLVIRDEETAIFELPFPLGGPINIKIKDKLLAGYLKKYYYSLWAKALPLDSKLVKKLEKTLTK